MGFEWILMGYEWILMGYEWMLMGFNGISYDIMGIYDWPFLKGIPDENPRLNGWAFLSWFVRNNAE